MVLQFYGQFSAGVEFDNLNEEERLKPFIYAKDANGNPYSPSWYTLNFKSNFKLSKHVVVSCGVENILDQRYRPYSSGLVAGGRNVSVSLKANL
jgi:hemoglobin/transferrin/lactoferrin receptor protein